MQLTEVNLQNVSRNELFLPSKFKLGIDTDTMRYNWWLQSQRDNNFYNVTDRTADKIRKYSFLVWTTTPMPTVDNL